MAVLATGGVAGLLVPLGVAAGALTLVWMATALRLLRLDAVSPKPGQGPGPGGAGVREPRRPTPHQPSDAIRLPEPGAPPGGAAAWG
ncbi:hypothetical protein [Actinoallomurus acanthiterrae]